MSTILQLHEPGGVPAEHHSLLILGEVGSSCGHPMRSATHVSDAERELFHRELDAFEHRMKKKVRHRSGSQIRASVGPPPHPAAGSTRLRRTPVCRGVSPRGRLRWACHHVGPTVCRAYPSRSGLPWEQRQHTVKSGFLLLRSAPARPRPPYSCGLCQTNRPSGPGPRPSCERRKNRPRSGPAIPECRRRGCRRR